MTTIMFSRVLSIYLLNLILFFSQINHAPWIFKLLMNEIGIISYNSLLCKLSIISLIKTLLKYHANQINLTKIYIDNSHFTELSCQANQIIIVIITCIRKFWKCFQIGLCKAWHHKAFDIPYTVGSKIIGPPWISPIG